MYIVLTHIFFRLFQDSTTLSNSNEKYWYGRTAFGTRFSPRNPIRGGFPSLVVSPSRTFRWDEGDGHSSNPQRSLNKHRKIFSLIFTVGFWIQIIFSNFNSNCSIILVYIWETSRNKFFSRTILVTKYHFWLRAECWMNRIVIFFSDQNWE